MTFSEKSLKKFREIYKREYGEELSAFDLERKARILLNLYLSVYGKPNYKKDTKN